MTSKEHKKHTALVKPDGGQFHRNELALIGAPCGYIQELAGVIERDLRGNFRLGYADADHGSGDSQELPFEVMYTDKINYHSAAFRDEHLEFSMSAYFQSTDAVLINGNHFSGASQIVLVHPDKKESLSRKLDRLTNVILFVLAEGVEEPWSFLKDSVQNFNDIPVVRRDEVGLICRSVKEYILFRRPVVKGLVLAGGQSLRMGTDKGAIEYFGKPQRDHVAEMLSNVCDSVWISTRDEHSVESSYPLLKDSFVGLGPYGGILSAFREDPNAAWLCVACDVPLLDLASIQLLVNERDESKVATCFHNPETNFPEPLITLWEPRAYPRLLHFLAKGYSCPRKALINSDSNEIKVPNPDVLTNVNTPEELERIKNRQHV
ncbi:NTP transferase domain-containing protein [Fulvivirga sedimenti]|uniref:Probable molybdenum cofactor guanylyltransferase n=1 Tax=Fulvivirga sedimenti TaxID=2879465 RepID=A0A9X1KV74_9BACT|nr:NTP transferase domain-containing protein [Fulvivirga sedimenti]